jgi:hypothetical protein
MKVSKLIEILEAVEGDPEVRFLTGHGDRTPEEYDIANASLEEDGKVYLYSWVDDPTPRLLTRID